MKLTGFDLDVSKTDVYGVYRLACQTRTNRIVQAEAQFRSAPDIDHMAQRILPTVFGSHNQQIVYYTSDGAYEIPVTVEIPVLE